MQRLGLHPDDSCRPPNDVGEKLNVYIYTYIYNIISMCS
jgi:hypothetical protein